MAVGNGEGRAGTVGGKAGGGAELRDGEALRGLHGERGGVHVGGEGVVADMILIEPVDVVGGSKPGVGSVRLDEALQNVDGLGDVGHGDAAGAGGEDVEAGGGDDGVAEAVGLTVSVFGGGAAAVPESPFVDDEPDGMVGIFVVLEDAVGLGDVVLKEVGFGDEIVVLGFVVAEGLALKREVAVDGESLEAGEKAGACEGAEQFAIPGGIVADGDELRAEVQAGEIGDVVAVFGGVFLRSHVAAAAPVFVPYPPVFDAERAGLTVGAALVDDGEIGVAVAVLKPVHHLLRRAGADVAADVGDGVDLAAEVDEFVGAEAVGLGSAPEDVAGAGTGGGVADAVAPVVVIGEAAAGPAEDGGADGPKRVDGELAEAVGVGDGGFRSYPDAVVNTFTQVFDEVAVVLGIDAAEAGEGIGDDGCG